MLNVEQLSSHPRSFHTSRIRRVLNAADFQWTLDVVDAKLAGGGGRSKSRETVGVNGLDATKIKDAREVVDAIVRRTACR
jgi:hypothetical protein